MIGPPAARPNALPDSAKRAARAEPSRVEVRDADGRLLRIADAAQANRLLLEGAARWSGYGTRRHLRLTVALAPNSLRTMLGRSATVPSNPMAVYHHNPACRLWPREPIIGPAGPKLPRAEWDCDGGKLRPHTTDNEWSELVDGTCTAQMPLVANHCMAMEGKTEMNNTTGSGFDLPNMGVPCARNSVPPEIAAYDFVLAGDLMPRLMQFIDAARALRPPYEPRVRHAIEGLIDMAPRLMSYCEALVANVTLYFDLSNGKNRDDWRLVMERRNAAVAEICAYADIPGVLDHFATERRLLGLRKSFKTKPTVSGFLAREDPKDWKMSNAVAEALISADWQTRAHSPYRFLRRAAANIQYDRVRDMTRESRSVKRCGTRNAPGILLSLDQLTPKQLRGAQLQSAVAELRQHFKEGPAGDDPEWDSLSCEYLADTPRGALQKPRYTKESVSALLAAIQADPEMGAYVKAKTEFPRQPSKVRESLGWGATRVKRTRERLRCTAERVLIRATA